MMMEENKVPKDLLYSKEHEWVRIKDDRALIGITDFAQNTLCLLYTSDAADE